MSKLNKTIKLENFDDLFIGNPEDIEKNLTVLLPEAFALPNKSIYLQILSQIALAQAMQKKFQEAHLLLNKTESMFLPNYKLAEIRILLERGRVYHQENMARKALQFFKKSYKLSKQYSFDFHTIDAAHMIAIVLKDPTKKIQWNNLAINFAKTTNDKKGSNWLGALYNNIAQNYLEANLYEDAIQAFKLCKKYGKIQNDHIVIRTAKWGIARTLRSLGLLNKALSIQKQLLKEYEEIPKKSQIPAELIRTGRGLVYEELTEIYQTFMKKFASLADADLSQDPGFIKLEPKRLAKMKRLHKF